MPPGHPPKTSQNRPKSPPRRNFFALKFRPRFGIDFFTFWAPSWGRLGPQDGTSYTPKSIQKSTPKRGAQKHGSRSLPRPPKTPPRSPRDLPRPSLTPPWPPQALLPDPRGLLQTAQTTQRSLQDLPRSPPLTKVAPQAPGMAGTSFRTPAEAIEAIHEPTPPRSTSRIQIEQHWKASAAKPAPPLHVDASLPVAVPDRP